MSRRRRRSLWRRARRRRMRQRYRRRRVWNRRRRVWNGRRRELSTRQWRPQWRSQTHRSCRRFFRRLRLRSFFHAGRASLGSRRFRLRRGRFRRRLLPRGFRLGGALRPGFCVTRNCRRSARALPGHTETDLESDVVVERAGVRLLVGNTQLCQRLKNYVGLYFELAGQLIDTNFTHTITFRASQVFVCANGFSRNFGFSFSGPQCGCWDFRALYPIRFVFNRFII